MNIEETNVDEIKVITPVGSLDAQTEKGFQDSVLQKIDEGAKSILLDFSKLDYISSAGLRAVLIIAKKQKESGGKLGVSGLRDNVAEVFSVSGFDSIVDVYENQDSGVQGLK